MTPRQAIARFIAGRAARIILAGSNPVDAPDNTGSQVSDIILSNLVVREDASNGLVGYLYVTGTTAAVTFSITSDPDSIFAIQNGNELHKVDAFGTGADYAITIKATETVGGAEYSEEFTIDVIPAADEEDDSGIGGGGGSGDVETPDPDDPNSDTDPFIQPPVEVVTEIAAKISGKNGGTGVFLKDWGVPVGGRVYVMKYSADWSGMSAQGRYAAVGFGFKQANSFHMIGLRGNGAVSTTMLASRLYGDWRKSKQFTITNDGAAEHGTKNGPNWLRLTIASDGTTYTLESSADGATWASELADAAPSPLTDTENATQFGPAAYFYEEDKGPFVISISEFWQKPVNTVAPAITGTETNGQTLTASTGTWTGAGITYTYQWKRAGVNIASATASTYVLQAADVGSTITVAVTATNDGGATTATSAATGTIQPSIPVNTVAPAITGTVQVGQQLTCSSGTWSGGGSITYAYQWKIDGTSIVGATNSTYTVLRVDEGGQFTCVVTATNAAGSGSPATSNTTTAVPDPNFSSVVLLLGLNGADAATSTTDESPTTPHTITFNGNAQLDTAQAKFGSASLLLDGTGDFLSAPANADFQFGTGEFTVEGWIRKNGGTTGTFFSAWGTTNAARSWTVNWTAFGLEVFWIVTGTNVQRTIQYAGWSPQANTWHHIAFDRDSSGVMRIYVDGVMGAKDTDTSGIQSTNGGLNIGRTTQTGIDFNGWIDEVRITKGAARYASDSGYTVPVRAFSRA